MDEHVAKVVTDLSFGTGSWPRGQSNRKREERTQIGGHGPIRIPVQRSKSSKKSTTLGLATTKAGNKVWPSRQCWERIWAASVRARSRAISM